MRQALKQNTRIGTRVLYLAIAVVVITWALIA